jgi:probable aminopeptidase NPEPL1
MGGAAGQFGAFLAAARLGGIGAPLHCVLCLAENAVSEHALRNDDVITMYSGLTVEVNNTDCEGRLVLGDGVAYCAKHLSPRLVIDMATLTGAQGVSTGLLHSALYCNDETTERQAVAAGLASGDYAFPILYAPELHLHELKSQIADMKNSVKNRTNAQSSCAGSFILRHLFHAGYTGPALHIDMAYPVENDSRATGYGVALISKLLNII